MMSPRDDSDLEKLIEEAKLYDCVRFTWSDIHGIQRVAHMMPHNLESKIRNGTGVVHIHIMGGPRCEIPDYPKSAPKSDGNCYMKPMSGTLHAVPWAGDGRYKIGQIICESFWTDGTPQAAHPRFVARQQMERLEKLGYTLKSAWEVEFTLSDINTRRPISDGKDEFSMVTMQPQETIFLDLIAYLSQIGIKVDKFNTEWYPGVFEVNLLPEEGIRSADNLFTFKGICKEVFKKDGMIASFMPSPNGNPSAVFHFNHSLWDKAGANLFSDSSDSNGLSPISRWWVAGLVKHLPALTVLLCPTANCYRVIHDNMAADKADWGIDNRHATIRMKNQTPGMTFVENRLPSSAANPYIVLAATVAAGLDGITNKLELPAEMDPGAPTLPCTLEEAISALEEDNTIIEAIGGEFVDWFLTEKKSVELEMFKEHNMRKVLKEEIDKEMDEYFIHI